MIRRRISGRHRHRSRPRFLWQGLLIILPAVILAAFGLASLRQDRVLAEHDAGQTATQFAAELVQKRIPEELQIELPPAPDVIKQMRESGSIEDPVARAAASRPPRIVLRISETDELQYPARVSATPKPRPLLATALNAAQEDAWITWQTLCITAATAGDVETGLNAFLGLNPPAEWAGLARFRTALAAREKGDNVRAVNLFRQMAALDANAVTESGYDLRPFAELEGASLIAGAQPDAVEKMCRHWVSQPTRLTQTLLRRAESLSAHNSRWSQLFTQHERARDYYAALRENMGGTFSLHGEQFFSFVQPADDGRWIVGISRDDLGGLITRVVADHPPPPHFGVAISFGEEPLFESSGQQVPLAILRAPLPVYRGELPLVARVFLTEPDRFFAKQRARTLRFGALITVSAAAVFAGFITAWRAFRRQEQLSELKTNFVSSVSHELRAPIASVRLMAEELENGVPPTRAKLREYHRFIGQECRRLSALIENVLDFSRREQGREEFAFGSTDIRALFDETVSVMEIYAAEKEVLLEKEVRGKAVPITADGRALQRVLINLLDNAIKHSPRGSTVVAGLELDSRLITFWVEDNGPGIPAAQHEHIFERFYRIGSELRRETPGVGLGLSIVKRIVEVHGGRVQVRSEVGNGSRFTVELPFACDSPAPVETDAFA